MTEQEIQEYKDKYKYSFSKEEDNKKLLNMLEEDIDEMENILTEIEQE